MRSLLMLALAAFNAALVVIGIANGIDPWVIALDAGVAVWCFGVAMVVSDR